MQDKDFDQFIRNAADNFPEPEYNPADWDMLEDRLHNLNTPQTEAPVSNPLPGAAGFGKLAMVASAVVVTAINTMLYFAGDKKTNDYIAAKETSTTQTEAPVVNPVETVTAITAVTPGFKPENNSLKNYNTKSLAVYQQGIATNPLVLAAPGKLVKVSASNKAKESITRSDSKSLKNQHTPSSNSGFFSSIAISNQVSRQDIALGGANNGLVNTNGINDACLQNETPELSYAIIGADTIYSSRIGLNACQQYQIRLITTDKETDQVVVATNVPENLPGATVSVTKSAQPEIIMNWNPDASVARQKPYTFTIWLKDNHCPDKKPRVYNYTLSVTPAFTLALNGITSIEKGQTTSLEAAGAPKGSSFKWAGPGFQTNSQAGKVFVAPRISATYTVQVTSPSGCIYTDSVRVDVNNNNQPELMAAKYIPNIFTPNGDGSNDYFEVRLPETGPVSLVVFDRWNRKVYSNTNYRNTWEAENLPAGTYYYLITVSESKKTYKGWVEVIR